MTQAQSKKQLKILLFEARANIPLESGIGKKISLPGIKGGNSSNMRME
jgi:hypothetical protein